MIFFTLRLQPLLSIIPRIFTISVDISNAKLVKEIFHDKMYFRICLKTEKITEKKNDNIKSKIIYL